MARNRSINGPPKVEAPPQDWWQQKRAADAAAVAETIAGPKRRHEGTTVRLRPAKSARKPAA